MFHSFVEDYGYSSVEGFDLSDLEVDEAYLRISSNHEANLTLYQKSTDCYRCPYRSAHVLPQGQNLTLKYNTKPYWSFILSSATEEFIKAPGRSDEEICFVKDASMGQFGIYEMTVNPTRCDFKVLKEPVFIYAAIIFAIIFYLALGITWHVGKSIYKRCRKSKTEVKNPPMTSQPDRSYERRIPGLRNPHLTYFGNTDNNFGQEISPTPKKTRLRSLDTFRGITIVSMLLVNHGGGKYWFLQHAVWNGITYADFVFPWFLWIMGVCIPMGVRSQLRKNVPKTKILLRILQRSLKLFALGIMLNTVGGHNQLETLRIPGVLQRFAVAYLVTSSVYLLCGPSASKDPIKGFFGSIDDVIVLFPQWVLYILIMIGHAMFIFYMPNPGCPRGYIGPGGIVLLQNGAPSPDCVGGVTRMVDIWVLGDNHIFQHPSPKSAYDTSSFDPEGILGCVPTLLQVFLGIQAGQILQSFEANKSRVKRWTAWGFMTIFGSLALSSGIIIGGPIPVNKNLWSLSYVLITSGAGFILLAVCYVLIDYAKVWKGSPFYQTGMNSIFLYVMSFLTYNVFPWSYRFGNMKSHLALFTEALFGTSVWVIIALYLHRKKKFYTV